MTGWPKTGDELYDIVLKDLEYALKTYLVEIIAICTDNGPDGLKMRRLIKQKMPWIAVFECWAHQAHLITGNFLAVDEPWMKAAKEVIEIIKFFNHHQTALDLLRSQTFSRLQKTLMLLLPVVTRWLSQYVCMRRVLRFGQILQTQAVGGCWRDTYSRLLSTNTLSTHIYSRHIRSVAEKYRCGRGRHGTQGMKGVCGEQLARSTGYFCYLPGP